MADKTTQLSIVVRTVDNATARIKAINDRLEAAAKPFKDFREQLGKLKENSGLNAVISGVKGVGSAIGDLVGKVGLLGGVLGAATAGVFHLIEGFDELGDKAEHIGVGVDFLAQLRYAAKRSGAEVEQLDAGLQGFVSGLGQARAGTGKLAGFLKIVSPALLKQVKAAKSNEEAFGLVADAAAKLEDPAKQAAFAQKVLGDPALAGLLHKGAKGIQELKDRYKELAGSQEPAVGAAGEFGDSMDDLHASLDGVKAGIVAGLAPALRVVVDRLREWFTAHREDIAEWAKNIGEKIPGAVQKVVEWIGKAYDQVAAFVDQIGGLKTVAIAAGAILAGPLLGSVVSLTGALVTAISRVSELSSGISGLGALGTLGVIGGAVAGAHKLANFLAGPESEWVKPTNGVGSLATDVATKSQGANWLFLRQQMGMAPDLNIGGIDTAEPQQAEVTVKFENAPPGTRVSKDPKSTAAVETNVGYQMGASL